MEKNQRIQKKDFVYVNQRIPYSCGFQAVFLFGKNEKINILKNL